MAAYRYGNEVLGPIRIRQMVPAFIAVTCILICLLLNWGANRQQYIILLAFQKAENALTDFRIKHGKLAPRDPRLMLLAIDDDSVQLKQSNVLSDEEIAASPALQAMMQYPFPRNFYPYLLDRLFNAGARFVVFDMLFLSETNNDPALKAALDKYRDRVVIGWNFVEDDAKRSSSIAGNGGVFQFPSRTLIPLNASPYDPLDGRLGMVNVWPDSDDIVRSAFYHKHLKSERQDYDTLAMRTATKLGEKTSIPVDTRPYLIHWTGSNIAAFSIDTGFLTYPIYEIFVPKIWESNYKNGEIFRDKIIYVGAKGNFTNDVLKTPFGPMPGVEIHLNALNSLLHGDFINETPYWINVLLIVGCGLLAGVILYRVHSPVLAFLCFSIIGVVYLGTAQIIYNQYQLLIQIFFPMACFGSIGVFGSTYEFLLEQIERRRTRATLERYVSKNLVRELLDNPETFYNKLGGVRLPITALFSDVRDFTTMTERADPTQMVMQLNEYLQGMTRIVFANQGTLDKFVGDAVMAVWGNIQTVGPANDAENAVRTALAMLESLRQLNERWASQGMTTWKIGIGINQGEAIAGNIGSTEKMDLTVIGDAVNTASRLEGLTKKYHIPLLIGPAVALHVKNKFYLQSVDRAAAKGKSHALDLYTVLGDKSQPLSKEWLDYLECHEEGVRLFRIKNFTEALEMFDSMLAHRPDDFLAQMYKERCEEFMRQPPEESWNGVVVFTEK